MPEGIAKAKNQASALSVEEDSSNLMNRIEEKYIVKREYLNQLTTAFRENLKDGDVDTSTRYNVNKTIYLDNKDMDIFRDTLDDIKPRFKVRIRRYAPNEGQWENVAYLELKIKQNEMTNKVRIRIPETYIQPILDGNQVVVNNTLFDLNRDIPKETLWKRAAAMNSVIAKYGLRKQIVVVYERRAYTGAKIRVTVDENLRYLEPRPVTPDTEKIIRASDGWKKFEKSYDKIRERDYLILEVKHQEDYDVWLKKLLKAVGAQKVKFSKYSAAITACLNSDQKSEGHMTRPLKIDANSILATLGYNIQKSETFMEDETLGKASGKKGEGSKGGHVIGHTRSGKPIYANSEYHAPSTHDPKADYSREVRSKVVHVQKPWSDNDPHEVVHLESGHASHGQKKGKYKVGDEVVMYPHIAGTHILEHKDKVKKSDSYEPNLIYKAERPYEEDLNDLIEKPFHKN